MLRGGGDMMIDEWKEGEEGGCRSSNWGVSQQQLGGVAAVKGGVALDRPIYKPEKEKALVPSCDANAIF